MSFSNLCYCKSLSTKLCVYYSSRARLNSSSFYVYSFPSTFSFTKKDSSITENFLKNIKINNTDISVNVSKDINVTLLQTLDYLKIKVPRFCYHESLNIAGNCRMCLVELENSIKPVISCSTLVSSNMSVYTDTAVVRRIRHSILEFLLINHPLDCPVCDQGGRCDLQDLSFVFGQDISRYRFSKRAVSDIHFNDYVKTVMVRCIHCTRCIRFLTDVLNEESLGLMGRGNGSIISTYSNEYLSGSYVSNVIDLCPVGALTSKSNSSTYRIWERTSSYIVDFVDPLLSPIIAEVCSNRVVDILPAVSNINSFISDRTRLLWESLQNFRLTKPVVNYRFRSSFVSSHYIVKVTVDSFFIRRNIMPNSSFYYDSIDLMSSYAIQTFFGNFFSNNSVTEGIDSRSFFSFFSDYNDFIFYNIDLDKLFPRLFVYLNRNKSTKSSYSFGSFRSNNIISNYVLGNGSSSLTKFLGGRSYMLNSIRFSYKNKDAAYVLFGGRFRGLFSNYYNNSSLSSIFNFGSIELFGDVHRSEFGSSYSSYLGVLYTDSANLFSTRFNTNLFMSRKSNSLFYVGLHDSTSFFPKKSSLSFVSGLNSPFEENGLYINKKGKILNVLDSNVSSPIRDSFMGKFLVLLFGSMFYFTEYKDNQKSHSSYFITGCNSSAFFSFYNALLIHRIFSYISFDLDMLYKQNTRLLSESTFFNGFDRPFVFGSVSTYYYSNMEIECDIYSYWSKSIRNSYYSRINSNSFSHNFIF